MESLLQSIDMPLTNVVGLWILLIVFALHSLKRLAEGRDVFVILAQSQHDFVKWSH